MLSRGTGQSSTDSSQYRIGGGGDSIRSILEVESHARASSEDGWTDDRSWRTPLTPLTKILHVKIVSTEPASSSTTECRVSFVFLQ
jgi:hypothetical protein